MQVMHASFGVKRATTSRVVTASKVLTSPTCVSCSPILSSRSSIRGPTSPPSITSLPRRARGVAPTVGPHRRSWTTVAATPGGSDTSNDDNGGGSLIGSVGLGLLWVAFVGYALFVSPNQTPLRDQYFIEKLLKLTSDSVPLNSVFENLFFIMGVWPIVYTALLIPAAKSRNGVPAWPFVLSSYAVGAIGLLPYMALWQPQDPAPRLPPSSDEELEGIGNLMTKGMETPVVAWGALAGAVFCLVRAATAGGAAWSEYFQLLSESRLVHVTTLDFLTLTTLAPYWMSNDATLRRWEGRETLLPLLSVVPVLGPCVYLCLRPRAR